MTDVTAAERVFTADSEVGLITGGVGGADQQVVAKQCGLIRAILIPLNFTAIGIDFSGQSADRSGAGGDVASLTAMCFQARPQLLVVVDGKAALDTECSGGTDRIPADFATVGVDVFADLCTAIGVRSANLK